MLLKRCGVRSEVFSEVITEAWQPAVSMEFVKCLGHPEEFYNLLRFQMGGLYKVLPKVDEVG